MPQKYQNEKSPMLKGQKKPKTPGKVQKMSDLGGPTSIHPFENTLYKALLLTEKVLVVGALFGHCENFAKVRWQT